MNRLFAPSFAGLLALVATAPAAEFYVDNAYGVEGSGTRQSPFRTVQAAIDAAAPGDVIFVAVGTYAQNLSIQGKSLTLQGGFSRDWERDVARYPTALVGAGGNAVINLIESGSTIDGFRITGGTGSTEELPYGLHGGGIYSQGGSPTISNCIVENNDVRNPEMASDYHFGGGVHIAGAANATILNNVIRGNFAGRGGGLSVIGERALIQGNTVENNVAIGDHGGGLFIAVVQARITQNIVRGNEVGRDLTYGWGGGLIVVGAGNTAELSYNTLYENYAAGYGAAEFIDEGATADIHHELIYRNVSKDGCETVSAIAVDGGEDGGSRATIRFCTIAGNVCENSTRGNGLQVEGGSVVSVSNCIFWNNGGDDFAEFGSTLSVTYTCSEEEIDGVGNVVADPLFVNEAADDFRLTASSPCIDAGDPSASTMGGDQGRADMGRFGSAALAPVDDAIATGSADASDSDAAGTNIGSGSADRGSPADGAPAQTDAPADEEIPITGTAMCPMASALLFAAPLIGMRRRMRKAN